MSVTGVDVFAIYNDQSIPIDWMAPTEPTGPSARRPARPPKRQPARPTAHTSARAPSFQPFHNIVYKFRPARQIAETRSLADRSARPPTDPSDRPGAVGL